MAPSRGLGYGPAVRPLALLSLPFLLSCARAEPVAEASPRRPSVSALAPRVERAGAVGQRRASRYLRRHLLRGAGRRRGAPRVRQDPLRLDPTRA